MDSKVSAERSLTHHIYPQTQPVIFEDYLFYAAIQRREEENDPQHGGEKRTWFSKITGENGKPESPLTELPSMTPDQVEHANASRALRLASWMSAFYLITTDILGPFSAPFAISQLGWVPGVILYFFMGLASTYSGFILWHLFLKMDSLRFPLKTYADIGDRIFGKVARHVFSILQTIQLVMIVGLNCLTNGQSLSQIAKGRLCFSVCVVIFPIIGFMIGQIRTLKNFSWLANSAVWLNLAIIFISMGFIAHSPPNYAAAKLSLGVPFGPIVTTKFVSLPLFNKINGVMNMVFAYGGAMIFPEIMAEMRRPFDFWKGFTLAQLVIFVAYLLYGCYVYAFQGQFTLPSAYQGVSKYSWQTVGNVLSLVTGVIAAGLYGNIGVKVVYHHIFVEWFSGPSLMSKRGMIAWFALVLVYWSIAFVIGSAIPQIGSITSLVGAVAIMQFTYTFPPLLLFGYQVTVDAMSEDEPYIPGNGTKGRKDKWSDWSRWKRGLFSGRWYFKLFNLAVGLGGLATACLGMWGSGESIKALFQVTGGATSFGSKSPV